MSMVRFHHRPPYGTVAQWLERKPDKLEVDGSIPSRPTMKQMP